ncbi:MAG: peptidoglycan-binding protein [Roseitalea sp.]|nr:peptidoglycan-binding protein [Roseitalea sp.]MBO6952775.1 peptidoglycan-binding protein [Rhizobiaceae bacterium]MBO6592738.1 peptidoglycan-binding protein [Roseitalea sp.]MBO6600519.1 peptidoglycan-binding protein [Roseitalea sp.]MBO6612939.1 peptidoglycan-binding protein [Roseitalea sp.]
MKKTIAIVLSLTVTSLLAVLVTTQISRSDEWPLKDGRYATDPSFCAYDAEQILDAFGDAASLSLRTFKNSTIDFHYESTCRIEKIKVDGSDLLFTKVCSAEGEEFEERASLVVNSPTSFTDGQTTFNLCEGSETASFDADAIYSFQVSLNFLGFNAGAPDGKFGSRTREAMNAFQRQNGLPVTAQPNATTLKAALDAERAIYESAKHVEPATVEPSAGDDSVLDEITDEQATLISARQDRIRRLIIERQGKFLASLREYTKYLEGFDQLYDPNAFYTLVMPTTGFTLCPLSSNKIIALYNVTYSIWILIWVDDSDNIIHARISGPIIRDGAGTISGNWEEYVAPDRNILEAMDLATREQFYALTSAFHTVLESNCSKGPTALDQALSADEELTGFSLSMQAMNDISEKMPMIRQHVYQEIARVIPWVQQDQIVLTFAAKTPELDGVDLTTAATVTENNNSMFVANWIEKNGALEVVNSGSALLLSVSSDE